MYKNYGDANFFEYGRLVKQENEIEVRVIGCTPYSDKEEHYQFFKVVVDITDSWIDREAVMKYGGMEEQDFNPIHFALDCIEFYGPENFGNVFDIHYKDSIIENLDEYLSDDDIEDRSCYKDNN